MDKYVRIVLTIVAIGVIGLNIQIFKLIFGILK